MNWWRPLWWFIIYDHRSNLLYLILIGVYGFLNTIGTKSYYWQCSPCWISLHEQHNNFYVIYFRVAHLITTWNLSLIYMFYLHLIYIYMITHPHISVVYLSIYIYIYIYIKHRKYQLLWEVFNLSVKMTDQYILSSSFLFFLWMKFIKTHKEKPRSLHETPMLIIKHMLLSFQFYKVD